MKKTDSMKEQSAHRADVLSGEDGLVELRNEKQQVHKSSENECSRLN